MLNNKKPMQQINGEKLHRKKAEKKKNGKLQRLEK